MHFGKIVKRIAHQQGFSAKDLAAELGRSEKLVLELYEQEEWTSGTIKAASVALDHDFGKYLNSTIEYDFMSSESGTETSEVMISVKYPKGKEFLLKTWMNKMTLIAKAIGLELKY
jgi:hypothetical protein